jgi:hypothetical protein
MRFGEIHSIFSGISIAYSDFVITQYKKGSPLMNLTAQLKQNNQTILSDLDYILLQIPDSETGEEYCSGFFQIPNGTSIEPDLYRLVLPDMTEAEILIMRSFFINEENTAFFSVVGDFAANASTTIETAHSGTVNETLKAA